MYSAIRFCKIKLLFALIQLFFYILFSLLRIFGNSLNKQYADATTPIAPAA